jgi:hypothetical protein
MTDRPIGYYVHHHGAGHRARAHAIAATAARRIVLLGTDIGSSGIDLPDDRPQSGRFDGEDGSAFRPHALHYAPLDHAGIRARVATIARWIEAHRPALMIVDVSVEIAMLARLASVPFLYVRLNGDRSDPAHLEALRGAQGLLAPFHADLEMHSTPAWVREKSRYLPGIVAKPVARSGKGQSVILVVIGRGGQAGDGDALAQAATACPQWQWRVIGPCSTPGNIPANLTLLGWVEDPNREIAEATVVVGAAGDGLVGSVLEADRPFICLPQDRPYGEQRATAQRLSECGAALVLPAWPDADCWTGLINEARALPAEARRNLHNPNGAHAAAQWICAVAGSVEAARGHAA